jgi:hypothetical protein
VIPAAQEAEIWKIVVQSQPGQKVRLSMVALTLGMVGCYPCYARRVSRRTTDEAYLGKKCEALPEK